MASVKVGSTPGSLDIEGIRGDKWGPIQCTPQTGLDLSGRTWLAQIRATKDRPSQLLASFEVDTTDAATGVLRLTLLPAESGNLATGPAATPDGVDTFPAGEATYWWDLQGTVIADPTDKKTWFAGKIRVHWDASEEVTP